MKAEAHTPVTEAAEHLAELRARARAIMANRFLTTAGRVAMLRENELALMAALRHWRALSGIAPMCSSVPSTARVGRYRAW